jgi:Lar family restriction alleviation protein
MSKKLKDCPLCGGKVRMVTGIIAGLTMIYCEKCGLTASFRGQEKPSETEKAWNRREKPET